MSHPKMIADLNQAADGRWVMLIEPSVGAGYKDGPTWNDHHIPPVIIAKWVVSDDGHYGAWSSLWAAGQGEGFVIENAKGFVELADLGVTV